jgi:UDPglucose 6-dehydrogenase/GDP-mannose 6-dehydrogenase
MLGDVIRSGKFSITTDTASAVQMAEIVIVTVGTPSTDGAIDLSSLGMALDEVGLAIGLDDRYRVIVIKSTVVPMTTDTFALGRLERASGKSAGKDFGLAMNPEFLREGSAIADFHNPDRIVIGEFDSRSGDVVSQAYESYDCPKVRTSLRNAELIKYSSNALLATLISFSNEIAAICESVDGLDVEEVMDGLHLDRRLTPIVDDKRISPGILAYLKAGSGFGGSCLPKDVSALQTFARTNGVSMPLLEAALAVNASRAHRIVGIIESELGSISGRCIGILGLAFKAGTDDLRDSASLRIADLLLRAGADVRAYDPVAMSYSHNSIDPRIIVADSGETIFAEADAVVLMTAWPEFSQWDFTMLTQSMRTRIIVDGRNALRAMKWPESVRYRPIGTARARQAIPVG